MTKLPALLCAAALAGGVIAGCGDDPAAESAGQTAGPAERVGQERSPTRAQTEVRQRSSQSTSGSRREEDGERERSVNQVQSITQTTDGNGSSSSSSQTSQQVTQSASGSGSQSSTQTATTTDGDTVRTIAGTGEVGLGTVQLREPSRLTFTNPEGSRLLVTSARGTLLDTRETRGEVPLPAGDLEDVRVRGEAFTIVIRPR